MNKDTLAIAQQILAHNERLIALLEGDAPAKTPAKTRKPAAPKARKAPAPKAPKAPVTRKGDQTRETLSRKDWNRTLTTLAKTQPKGSGAYKRVLDAWADVQVMRTAGATPSDALAWVLEG